MVPLEFIVLMVWFLLRMVRRPSSVVGLTTLFVHSERREEGAGFLIAAAQSNRKIWQEQAEPARDGAPAEPRYTPP